MKEIAKKVKVKPIIWLILTAILTATIYAFFNREQIQSVVFPDIELSPSGRFGGHLGIIDSKGRRKSASYVDDIRDHNYFHTSVYVSSNSLMQIAIDRMVIDVKEFYAPDIAQIEYHNAIQYPLALKCSISPIVGRAICVNENKEYITISQNETAQIGLNVFSEYEMTYIVDLLLVYSKGSSTDSIVVGEDIELIFLDPNPFQ